MESIMEGSALTVLNNFTLSPSDAALLSAAYLPIIGTDAFSLYWELLTNPGFGPKGSLRFGKDLNEVLGLSFEKIQLARTRLEGLGLLKTFYREDPNGDSFVLVVKPPRSARSFFADLGLKGLLSKAVSTGYAQSLEASFAKEAEIGKGFADVTTPMSAVYLPISGPKGIIDPLLKGLEDKEVESRRRGMDTKAFAKALAEDGLTSKVLGGDMDQVLSLADFFGLGPKEAADSVAEATNSENRFNLKAFTKLCEDRVVFGDTGEYGSVSPDPFFGNTQAAQQFKVLDQTPIPEVLAALLNQPKAPPELVQLAYKIKKDFNFNDGVVNTIFDFVIKETGQIPFDSYFTKVALSLVPKKPTNAYETALIFKENQYDMAGKKRKEAPLREAEGLAKAQAGKDKEKDENSDEKEKKAQEVLDKIAKSFGY